MAVVKQFECEQCGAQGKITLKGSDYEYRDIECCPICGSYIQDEDQDDEE